MDEEKKRLTIWKIVGLLSAVGITAGILILIRLNEERFIPPQQGTKSEAQTQKQEQLDVLESFRRAQAATREDMTEAEKQEEKQTQFQTLEDLRKTYVEPDLPTQEDKEDQLDALEKLRSQFK